MKQIAIYIIGDFSPFSGECPQYLGMISKNNKEVVDLEETSIASSKKKTEAILPVCKTPLAIVRIFYKTDKIDCLLKRT